MVTISIETWALALSLTDHLWEDLVINNFLGQVINHARQIFEQADSYSSIWIRKKSYYHWCDPRTIFVVRDLGSYLHYRSKYLWSPASKLYRLEKLRKDLHIEKLFRKIICHFIKLTREKLVTKLQDIGFSVPKKLFPFTLIL